MKLTSLRRSRAKSLPGLTGTAKLGRRTTSVAKRVDHGDIVIIDHVDIDRSAAVALVEAGAAAVVNVAPSTSGRYPNLGPRVLTDAGVVLIDDVGGDIFTGISDGETVRVDGDTIFRGEDPVATGVRQSPASVGTAMETAKDGIPTQLEAFAANAVEHLRHERDLLLDGEGLPDVATSVKGRHVLVVVRAFDYRAELKRLKTYIRENSPVMVGVDGGADALLAAGHRPDLVVTNGDDISEAALRCGAEVVAHGRRDGRIAGGERIERLGVRHHTFSSSGTNEDVAVLLAHAGDASLIVTVGSHSSLVEFLDKGRSGMASSFLTRTAVGSKLADARAVAQLYQNRVRAWVVLLVLLVALALVAGAVATTPVGQDWWDQLSAWVNDGYDWVKGQVT
ncbi:MAG: putative cytokinetic ring protein SteA [Nocardioidaceae bacterium]